MSVALSVAIIVSLATVTLGLIAYNLLGRLERLERAVQGGIEAPSLRLSREQFEQRFRIAHARSQLGEHVETGIIVVLGDEALRGHELVATLRSLSRPDHVHVLAASGELPSGLGGFNRIEPGVDLGLLGVTTTPFVFIIDQGAVRSARPLAGSDDLIGLLETST